MGQINVLDISVANLIAAGEVVDRPASAIKELVENSIDAGAKKILIEIQKGGVSMFRVTDDGCGMNREDAVLCTKRHATSKIKTAKDLNEILTLGFRGEALAAISAVTKFRMLTKREEDASGTSLVMEYGSAPKIAEVGCPNGTTIICEGLFATTPARLKFLKSDVSEAREVQNAVEKEAVSHPNIAFRLISDGTVKFASNGNGKLTDAIYSVYGKEFANSLTPVSASSGGITVEGFVSSPQFVRGNRGMQIFFVNGRPVRSKILTAALEQACQTYVPVGKYPSCVLNITIHSAYVDVNIHPSKLEVKFSDEKSIFSAIYYSVRGALESHLARPSLSNEVKVNAPAKTVTPSVTEAFTPVRERGEKLSEQLQIKDVATSEPVIERKPLTSPTMIEPLATKEEKQEPTKPTYTETVKAPSMPRYAGLSIEADEDEPKVSIPSAIGQPALACDIRSTNTDAKIPDKTANVIPEYRIVGEVFDSYVIVEYADKVLLVDKHAAHERINFEKLRISMRDLTPHTQLLLAPATFEITSREQEMIESYANELRGVGFVFEIKDACVVITGMPIDHSMSSGKDLFEQMVGELMETGTPIEIQKRTIFERALYQTSCKMSIKAGRHYDDETLKWICDNIFRYDCIKYCPHGRPVAYEMSKRELDSRFGRIK